jgi:hypothetical protein
LAHSGVAIALSTLGDWLAGAADLLEPLYQLMRQRLSFSRVIHGDHTLAKLRLPGEAPTAKAHLWGPIGEADPPSVVFDFTADYTPAGPARFPAGYRGYLQADALAQYEYLYGAERVPHYCCWAHPRRNFVAAAEGGDVRPNEAAALRGQLHAIDWELPPLLLCDDPAADAARRQREGQRRQLRQLQATPVLALLKKYLDEERPRALPKGLPGKPVGDALNNWEALGRYLEQGYHAIDNNLSEWTLRVVALGRNNWGCWAVRRGVRRRRCCTAWVQTCKHPGLDRWPTCARRCRGC